MARLKDVNENISGPTWPLMSFQFSFNSLFSSLWWPNSENGMRQSKHVTVVTHDQQNRLTFLHFFPIFRLFFDLDIFRFSLPIRRDGSSPSFFTRISIMGAEDGSCIVPWNAPIFLKFFFLWFLLIIGLRSSWAAVCTVEGETNGWAAGSALGVQGTDRSAQQQPKTVQNWWNENIILLHVFIEQWRYPVRPWTHMLQDHIFV